MEVADVKNCLSFFYLYLGFRYSRICQFGYVIQGQGNWPPKYCEFTLLTYFLTKEGTQRLWHKQNKERKLTYVNFTKI